jgi:hypothetical protein
MNIPHELLKKYSPPKIDVANAIIAGQNDLMTECSRFKMTNDGQLSKTALWEKLDSLGTKGNIIKGNYLTKGIAVFFKPLSHLMHFEVHYNDPIGETIYDKPRADIDQNVKGKNDFGLIGEHKNFDIDTPMSRSKFDDAIEKLNHTFGKDVMIPAYLFWSGGIEKEKIEQIKLFEGLKVFVLSTVEYITPFDYTNIEFRDRLEEFANWVMSLYCVYQYAFDKTKGQGRMKITLEDPDTKKVTYTMVRHSDITAVFDEIMRRRESRKIVKV